MTFRKILVESWWLILFFDISINYYETKIFFMSFGDDDRIEICFKILWVRTKEIKLDDVSKYSMSYALRSQLIAIQVF